MLHEYVFHQWQKLQTSIPFSFYFKPNFGKFFLEIFFAELRLEGRYHLSLTSHDSRQLPLIEGADISCISCCKVHLGNSIPSFASPSCELTISV